MAFKCLGCDGVFDESRSDGTLYFHVCPPLLEARVKRNGAWLFVGLGALQATDTIAVLRAGERTETTIALAQPGDVRLDDRATPRAAGVHRDENTAPPPPAVEKTPPKPRAVKSEGAGRAPA